MMQLAHTVIHVTIVKTHIQIRQTLNPTRVFLRAARGAVRTRNSLILGRISRALLRAQSGH
jgi:hypothetical protein